MARVWFLLTLLASCAPEETDVSSDSAPVFAHDDGTVQVGEAGLAVEGEEGSQIWLRTDRIGRDGLLQEQGNATARTADCGPVGPRLWATSCGPTFERDLPLATERWTLNQNGIQQGWTLWERPEGEGPLWIDV
ncbi:MAG TPA: hypothetical protein PKW90_19430, partial [Myxococcota bacterium]|nr:hypothetical protein [Myxococcota bacterium]